MRVLPLKIGDRLGKFTIVGYSGLTNAPYVSQCDCGTIVNKKKRDLDNNEVGCMKCRNRRLKEVYPASIENAIAKIRKPHGESAFRSVVRHYRESAKNRNVLFELSEQDIKIITSQSCHYCGRPPSQSINGNCKKKFFGDYIYNGIDRIDNKIGYTLENSLPCCRMCNFLKGRYGYEEFINQVYKIAANLNYQLNAKQVC